MTSTNHSENNLAVIGGGVIGLASAIALQRAGQRVTLIDGDADPIGASWGNAGHIAVEQIDPLASVATLRSAWRRMFVRGGALSLPPGAIREWAPFGLKLMRASTPARFARGREVLRDLTGEAIPAWRRLLDHAGAPDLMRVAGHLIAWESEGSARAGRDAWMHADTGRATVRDIDAADRELLNARSRGRIVDAVRVDGTGQIIDPRRLLDRLRATFVAGGGTVLRGRVRAVERDGPALRIDGERLSFDAIVMAAGVASGELLRPIGHRVPIIAERGYHLQQAVTQDEWPAETPPIVFEDRAMIVTRFETGLRAASFVEFSRAHAPADPRKWQRLRDHAAALGLPIGADAASWIGSRPTLPDYLPAIGRSDRAAGLYYAFGHQHLGLTLAATTGERVAATVVEGRRDPRLSLTRFEKGHKG